MDASCIQSSTVSATHQTCGFQPFMYHDPLAGGTHYNPATLSKTRTFLNY